MTLTMSPTGARIRILASVGIALAAVFIASISRAPAARGDSQRDVELFRAVVARMASGAPYYEAMGLELRQRRYPTASVFNWRTPFLYRAIAAMTPSVARAALVGLAVVLMALTAAVLRDHSTLAMLAGLVIQLGAVVSVLVPPAALLTEAWAGVLVALSFCAYRLRRWQAGVALGVAALFIRELAAPYVIVCAASALRTRQWKELTAWTAGMLVYAGFFAWHAFAVNAGHQPGDLAQANSWLYWGGPAFMMQTLRTNAWLQAVPAWLPVAPALLTLLVAACLSGFTAGRLRAMTATYLALFLAVGQPFNFYWGLLTAPMWAFVAADGVESLRNWSLVSFSSSSRLAWTGGSIAAHGGKQAYD
jgi:hypothetical protein